MTVEVLTYSTHRILWYRRWHRAGDGKRLNLLAGSLARVVLGPV